MIASDDETGLQLFEGVELFTGDIQDIDDC